MKIVFLLFSSVVTIAFVAFFVVPQVDTHSQERVLQATEYSDTGGLLINEILCSNKTGIIDDQGETSDWVEVYNSSSVPIRLGSYFLSDDEAVPTKWAFPNATIEPGGFHLVWMSGLGQSELSPEALMRSALTIPMETTLVEPGAQWKYLAAQPIKKLVAGRPSKPRVQKMPDGWADIQFDDTEFEVGTAGFGYGDEDDQTELPFGTTCVLIRHEFTLDKPLSSDALVLQMDYDDGFVAFLNGKQVCAANANSDPLTLNSVASGSHESAGAERFDLSKHVGLLRVGKNVLAIAGLNSHSSSSDMSVNPSLGTLRSISHANFALPKKRGALFLVGSDGKIDDQIDFKKQLADQSFGRSATDQTQWKYFLSPTPGQPNAGSGLAAPSKSKITFDPTPGVYENRVRIQIKSKSSSNVQVRFTADGSEPGPMSRLVGEPVDVEETSLIRAASFVGDERLGPIVSATYVVGEKLKLPILSVTMKPGDFENVHLQRAGVSRAGERPAFIEWIDRLGERQLATGAGFRLHGGAGRRGPIEKKKSYRLYFRNLYGEGRIDFPVIPDAHIKDFDKLVLRANSNDGGGHGAYIRDQVIRDLHRDMGGMAAAGDWCVLMINGINHGVYNVTERMDEAFFVSHLGSGQFDVIKTGETVLSGSRDQWNELRDFITSNDFADQATYERLSSLVDIENFTSYLIVNLWAQNFDWPHNNWYAARRVPDGKWIFLCWDAEWGLAGMPSGYQSDPYAFIDSGGAYGNGLQRNLFFALLSNPGYREYYQDEVRRHLAGGLATENVMRQVARHRDMIRFDIENEFERKGYGKERWRRPIQAVEEFAKNRNGFFQTYTDEYFSKNENLFPETDRVASLELGGRRHAIYRTNERQLRELVSNEEGTVWNDVALSELANSPSVYGSPSSFVYDNARHVIYRDEDGHLHLLSKSLREENMESWRHQDLTTMLELPVADCDPAVAVLGNVPHIVFRDRQPSRIHEIWFDKKWQHQPLPAAPRPMGGVRISASPRGMFVNYQTVFAAACEQTIHRHQMKNGRRVWDSLLVNSMPSQGTPIGFEMGGKRHVVFQADKKWPSRQPFVFLDRSAAPEFNGSHESLAHAWAESHFFRDIELVGEPNLQMKGDPCSVADPDASQFFVTYRDDHGSIQEACFGNSNSGNESEKVSWEISDLSKLAGAPPAWGDPEGYLTVQSGQRIYMYRGEEGHVHELRFDGKWRHLDLSQAAGLLSPTQ